jgi:hypothetical protein
MSVNKQIGRLVSKVHQERVLSYIGLESVCMAI